MQFGPLVILGLLFVDSTNAADENSNLGKTRRRAQEKANKKQKSAVANQESSQVPSQVTDSLLSSLALNREQVCDGEKLILKCPPRTQILVTHAFYGRLLPSTELCPTSERPATAQKKKKQKEKHLLPPTWEETYEDLSCEVSIAKDKISEKCQTSRKCKITASPQFFGQDPCPTTSKYLQVAFRCKPSQFNTESFCQDTEMRLQCSKKFRIALYSAVYGAAADNPVCSTSSDTVATYDCIVDVLPELLQMCQGQFSCNVSVSDDLFKNPCPYNVQTYLTVTYSCVREGVFAEDESSDSNTGTAQHHPVSASTVTVFVGATESESPESNSFLLESNGEFETEFELDEQFRNSFSGQSSTMEETSTKSSLVNSASATIRTTPSTASAHSVLNDGRSRSLSKGPADDEFLFIPEENQFSTTRPPRRTPVPPCLPAGIPNLLGISLPSFLVTWEYLQYNREKFILYFALGLTVGLSSMLTVALVHFCCCRHTHRSGPPMINGTVIRNSVCKKAVADDLYGTHSAPPTVSEEVARMEMGDFVREGNFTRFNHLTPPNRGNMINFYS